MRAENNNDHDYRQRDDHERSALPLWRRHFPVLAASSDEWLLRLLDEAALATLPANRSVLHVGTHCESYLLVLEGSVRVEVVGPNGHGVTLYRVGVGQSCVLTTSCLLSDEPYPAAAITETPMTAVALAAAQFRFALDRSRDFRQFVFANLGERLVAVVRRIGEVSFGHVDQRLAQALVQRAATDTEIVVTHQALASEVGSAREVVSRRLKQFETLGWVRLGRGKIIVQDAVALRQHAGQPHQ